MQATEGALCKLPLLLPGGQAGDPPHAHERGCRDKQARASDAGERHAAEVEARIWLEAEGLTPMAFAWLKEKFRERAEAARKEM